MANKKNSSVACIGSLGLPIILWDFMPGTFDLYAFSDIMQHSSLWAQRALTVLALFVYKPTAPVRMRPRATRKRNRPCLFRSSHNALHCIDLFSEQPIENQQIQITTRNAFSLYRVTISTHLTQNQQTAVLWLITTRNDLTQQLKIQQIRTQLCFEYKETYTEALYILASVPRPSLICGIITPHIVIHT